MVRDTERKIKGKKKNNHDFRHKAKSLDQLDIGDTIWISDRKECGTIFGEAETPRSYIVKTPFTTIRRNRRHLLKIPEPGPSNDFHTENVDNVGYRTRSARLSMNE